MSKRGDPELVSDIMEAIVRIEHYTKDVSYGEFLSDTKTQDAIIRNIEVIGEAVKNISGDFKKGHKSIGWKNIAGMGDKLVHQYFGMNLEIVWDVVTNKIPELKISINKLSEKMKSE
ncbi:DUF86 domain-containing protein [Candidatus Woesearchaeota archaeon]|nr:DUF86 domain-containing protein [Candidatus Woesearchaeota archaeon]